MRSAQALFLTTVMMLSPVSGYCHGGDSVDIRILSEEGRDFLTIPSGERREGRTRVIRKYLVAKREESYRIRVKNSSGSRVGVVIAVDGRNIINGQRSFLGRGERMYVVPAYGTTELDGWRTSLDRVNSFYFTRREDSYTEKTFGDSSAIGVIAVAVFREKQRPEIFLDDQRGEKKESPAPLAPPEETTEGSYRGDTPGTGFGKEQYSPAMRVQFTPEEGPSEKILIRYEWHDDLCRKRVLKCRPDKPNRLWDEDGFAPYPPGYSER